MRNNTFSFSSYRELISIYNDRYCDYSDIDDNESFVLLRHDVEFNILRAYEIAKLDNLLGIQSSFLFQVSSNAYNILSSINREIIKKMNIKFSNSICNTDDYEIEDLE